jgi:hypothetical protein
MKDLSRDELVSLVGGERALAVLWEENNLLSAMLAKAERELAHVQQQRAEERQRFEKLTARQANEFTRLSDAAVAMQKQHGATVKALYAESDEFARRVAELTAEAGRLQGDNEYFRCEVSRLRIAANRGGPVVAMADGAVERAIAAWFPYRNKIAMIKALRMATGLGLHESKEICTQIIGGMDRAAIEAAKEATD